MWAMAVPTRCSAIRVPPPAHNGCKVTARFLKHCLLDSSRRLKVKHDAPYWNKTARSRQSRMAGLAIQLVLMTYIALMTLRLVEEVGR